MYKETKGMGTVKKGVWLLNADNLTLQWGGQAPAPDLNLSVRISVALCYMRSKGHCPIFSLLRWRLIKAVISLWKSPQVLSLSGKHMATTGLSFEDEWASFNDTRCEHPHKIKRIKLKI